MIRPRLIVITDRSLAAPRPITEIAQLALQGGAPIIQLRDKHATPRDLYAQATLLLPIVHGSGGILIINDRTDVALAAGADGVHLGPADLPVAAARRVAPPRFIIGASTDDPQRALQLAAAGADYIGCGAVFATASKDVGGEQIGPRGVAAVAGAVSVPVVAVGGINAANIDLLRGSGAAGVAVIAAVMGAADPAAEVRKLLRAASAF